MSEYTDRIAGARSVLGHKAPCRAGTTANITLSGLQSVGGITTLEGDRILVKAQTAGAENGVRLASTGAWVRAKDFDNNNDVACGTQITITSGTEAGDWQISTADPIVLGTTSLAFTQVNAAAATATGSIIVYDTLAALVAADGSEFTPGDIVMLKSGSAFGNHGEQEFFVLSGTAAANGFPGLADDVTIIEATGGATRTLIRKHWYDTQEVNLLWYDPAVDGTTNSATQIAAALSFATAAGALYSESILIVPPIGPGMQFLSGTTLSVGSNVTVTGGGTLGAHSSLGDTSRLFCTVTLSTGAGTYAQSNITIDNITFDGNNRTLTTSGLSLVDIFSVDGLVIRNCTVKDHQRNALVVRGCKDVEIAGNHISGWGHPSNGIVVSGTANNGAGLVRLTVASTSTMATGNTRVVSGVLGTTEANGSWTVTVIDATHVDLQGSAYANAYVSSGIISSGIDGGAAIHVRFNDLDTTESKDVRITGNYMTNGLWSAIYCFAERALISNNDIYDVREGAIFTVSTNGGGACTDYVVTGNNINYVRTVYVDSCGIVPGYVGGVLAGNHISDCDAAGISIIDGCKGISITGNSIVDCVRDPTRYAGFGQITLRDGAVSGPVERMLISGNYIHETSALAPCGIACFRVGGAAGKTDNITITGNMLQTSSATNNISIEDGMVGSNWHVDYNTGAHVRIIPVDQETRKRLSPVWSTDFLTPTTAGDFVTVAINSGSIATAPSSNALSVNHPGIVLVQSSTTANSGWRVASTGDRMRIGGGEQFDIVIYTPAVFTANTFRAGFLDTASSAAPTDGVWMSFSGSGAVTGNTSSNGSASATATLQTLSASTWYHMRIRGNAGATVFVFEIFGDTGNFQSQASLSTDIPTAAGREVGVGFVATNSGTTIADIVTVDYMAFSMPDRRLARGALRPSP